MASDPTVRDETTSPPDEDPARQVRDEGAEEFMGPGFLDEVRKVGSKRRAFEFWYHPYTELAIFALVILSVVLLIVEVALPTGEPVGWMGGMAAGTVTGWFFWADIVITAILAVEYASKLWITPRGRRWFFVRNTWIELLSLLPVLRVFRLFRIFRTVRIFRLMRVLRTVRLMRTGNLMTRILQGFGNDIGQNRTGNVIIATYFVAAMLFGTVGILIFEKGAGSGLDTLADGLWWCVVTLSTVGYGDTVPQTPGGRIVAGIVMVLGLGFWSVMIGVFTTSLVKRARQKETIGLDILGIHDHVVIFGWNDNGVRLVTDFHAHHPFRHLVVVSEREELGLALDSRLHHLRADPTDDATMERAHIDNADTAVVLAESLSDIDDVDIDARTLLICLAARNDNPDLRLIVELLDEDNVHHAWATGADDLVVTQNYAGSLMSQCVQSPGVNRAYQELFDLGRGGYFAEVELPDGWDEQPFSELVVHLFETRGVTAIGIRRGDKVYAAPNGDHRLRPDDGIIVIQSRQPPPGVDDTTGPEDIATSTRDVHPSDHVVVCGWSQEARRMIADLEAAAPTLDVTVIGSCPPSSPIPSDIEYIDGDPTSEATLRDAGIDDAHAVVIVADRAHGGTPETMDARTILTALTVRRVSSFVHLIAELRNEAHLELAARAGVDEWLFSDQFSAAMLSQSLQSSGLSRLFTALFETGAGYALKERPAPPSSTGTSFVDALADLHTDHRGAPLGVRRHSSLYLPPPPDFHLRDGDHIFLIDEIR